MYTGGSGGGCYINGTEGKYLGGGEVVIVLVSITVRERLKPEVEMGLGLLLRWWLDLSYRPFSEHHNRRDLKGNDY